MEIHNLEESGFKCLKLVDYSTSDGDCNGGGGGWWDHSYSLQKLFQQFTDLLKTNPRLMAASGDEAKEAEVSAGFSAEVGQLLAQPSIVSLIDKFIASYGEDKESVKKSVTASAEYRTRGNQDYALGQMAQASYYYTMAIVYAPDVDPNDYHDRPDALSLAYGNRSAVFYELGKYEACLADIEHAFSTGCPPVKHPKMLLRKVECLLALERHREANDAWRLMIMDSTCLMSNIPGSISMETAARMRQITARVHRIPVEPRASDSFDPFAPLSSPSTSTADSKQMLSIINYLSRTGRYEPSTQLPPLSAKLETRATANGNHFLVAAKDIEPGDILLVESPFVSVLNRKFEFHFCHHCCRRLEVNIGKDGQELCIGGSSVPCTHCTRVLYCSTDCRTESWRQYHQFECAILPILYEMTNFGHLALRTIIVAGLDVASRVINRNFGNEEDDQKMRMPDFSDPKDVEANYETVYRLALPERDRPPAEFAQFQLASAVMVRALMKQSVFVRTDEEAKLVGTILQRHFIQAYVKSLPISSRISISESFPSAVQVGESDIGLGIYPYLASAWRHSCDANTEHRNVNGSLVLYRATKCIPAGTEVTMNLGTTFIEKNWNERKEILWNRYGFKCDCAKCVIESRDGLDGKYFPIGCKDCGSTLTRTSPTSTSFNCSSSSCSTVMSLSTVAQLYAQAESHLAILNRLSANGIITSPISTDRLTEAELHVSQLSEMKGMASYCKLSRLNYTLACLFVSNGWQNMAKFRQFYERSVDIFEQSSGICDALFLLVIKQVDVYRQDAITADGVSGRNRYVECYLQIMKRAIQLARLFTLADARDESTAPDVLVEESRYLWKIEQNLLERVKDFK